VIERVASKAEIRTAVAEARREGKTVGFVPTMGALHEGHLALVRAAHARTAFVVVSIFVNPTQFAPGEDYERYPRDLNKDCGLLAAEGVEIVFAPTPEVMYGSDPQVTVEPGRVAQPWEGALRPGHFRGVATIVTKLLNTVRPDLAFFGEKDYQQLLVVEKVVADLDLGVGIVRVPTTREADGLALSSRNAYLATDDRERAKGIPEALEAAVQAAAWGETDPEALRTAMREAAEERHVALDYAEIVDPTTLEPLTSLSGPARAIIAGRVGSTRLIDNCEIVPVASEVVVLGATEA
jgi:pantoate--beta-alanine ligase